MTSRRQLLLMGGCSLAGALGSASAWAGSYLDRAALLLAGGRKEAETLRRKLDDRELAYVVHRLAEARLTAARKMQIPKAVAQAHPHLLLTFEHYERAAAAATEGQSARFFVLLRKAREEERIFRGVIKQAGWKLPA